MSDKKVPVYLGEGSDRLQIGRASVEVFEDGSTKVEMSLDNPDWGWWAVGGFEPLRIMGIIPSRPKNEVERPAKNFKNGDRVFVTDVDSFYYGNLVSNIEVCFNGNVSVLYSKDQLERRDNDES